MIKKLFSLAILTFFASNAWAQLDSLTLNNGDDIIGEVKSMNKGILTIETDYSDSDFKIEWEKIDFMKTSTVYLVTSTTGERYTGTINIQNKQVVILSDSNTTDTLKQNQVVNLGKLESSSLGKLSANLSLGYGLTKANNLEQFNLRSNIGYMAEKWFGSANFNMIKSTQDDVDPIDRIDASANYNRILPKDWYVPINLVFLSNSEMLLNLRTNAKVGFGKYVIHSNTKYLGFSFGASLVNENYYAGNPDRTSWEGFIGGEWNLYDIGDFSLLTRVMAYPGITEQGRWRTDINLDTKYDLPYDFYINIGLTYNFDNMPIEGGSTTDYVFQTTFGWEL